MRHLARLLLALPLLACGDDAGDPPFTAAGSGGAGSPAGSPAAGTGSAGRAGTPAADSGGRAGPGAGGRTAAAGSGGSSAPPASGKSLIVGVGAWGYRASSLDGAAFAVCQNASTGDDHSPDLLRDVGYGAGVFIAVGGDANAMVMRSLDGEHWQEDLHPKQGCSDRGFPSSCDNWMGGVAYLAGSWLAGGGNGALMRSTDDGVTWQGLHPDTTPKPIRHLAAGSGRFVAGTDGGSVFVTADGGDSWKEVKLGSGGEGMRVAHGDGTFIAWGQGCFVSTTGGDDWDDCDAMVTGSASFVHDGEQWLARVDGGYASSGDGKAWTKHTAASFPSELLFDGKTLWGRSGNALLRGVSPDAMQRIDGVQAPDARSWIAGIILDSNLPVSGVPACSDRR